MKTQGLTIKRTLIMTGGPAAAAAGTAFHTRLVQRHGPTAAVAICHHTPEDTDLSAFSTAVMTAAAAVSPTTLATDLAQSGWNLNDMPEVALFLLLDTAVYTAATAQQLWETAVSTLQQHLGVDLSSTILWLMTDENNPIPSSQTLNHTNSSTFPCDCFTLAASLLNENGLRLTDETMLADRIAELLWTLITTPLRHRFEQLFDNPHTPSTIAVFGISEWAWSRSLTLTHLKHTWLQNLFAAWLARCQQVINIAQTSDWLTYRELNHEALLTSLQRIADKKATTHSDQMWHMPAPWHIPRLWTELRSGNKIKPETYIVPAPKKLNRNSTFISGSVLTADHHNTDRLSQDLETEGTDWTASVMQQLQTQLQKMLDVQPVGGIDAAYTWTMHVHEVYLEELIIIETRLAHLLTSIAASENALTSATNRMESMLAQWPKGTLAWGHVLLRPWRWGHLIWHYRRLLQQGKTVTRLLAEKQMQLTSQTVLIAGQETNEALRKMVRYLAARVDEIGDMVRSWQADLTQNSPTAAAEKTDTLSISTLYDHLFPDKQVETTAATTAIGGLGTQLAQLDETVRDTLSQFITDRLTVLDTITAVSLLTLTPSDQKALPQWWHSMWTAAAPLWRYDETCLDDTARSRQQQVAWICGSQIEKLQDQLEAAVDLPSTRQWIDAIDTEHIYLLRLRTGLTPAALSNVSVERKVRG